jgi:phage/plasmid primase-like uncharacterized protein
MGYMTFEQQVASHLQFLQEAGLALTSLIIDSTDFIRSQAKGEVGRGRYAYKTVLRELNNGMTGLMTWCRSERGQISTHKTYGYASQRSSQNETIKTLQNARQLMPEKSFDAGRIQKFWDLSSSFGESDYLKRKGVKAHRIRFRENHYGKVAVIPMKDEQEQLKGYQILNADGSKVFAKGIQINGLFHSLTDLQDNLAIGIAESYVTAATCFDLLPMPMVTAFTSDNLEHVAAVLRKRYPNSPLVIFADNDRHLVENKGMICAERALKMAQGNGIIIAPEFKNSLKVRDYSDWNDLVREIGPACASRQMWEAMQKTQDDRIKTFYI